MIIDPFEDIIAECRNLGDDVVTAICNPEKLIDAGGYRYKKARRPELYGEIISRPHKSEQHIVWLEDEQDKEKK